MNVMDIRATSAMLYLDGVHVSFDGFHAINKNIGFLLGISFTTQY